MIRLRPEWFRLNARVDAGNPGQSTSEYYVKLHGESSVVPLAVDIATCDEMNAIASAKFGFGYPRLLREQRVIEVPGNSLAVVLEEEKSRVQIKISEEGKSVIGWIPVAWLRSANTEWTPSTREPGDGALP